MEYGPEIGTIAGRSRSMHKTQGFGDFGGRGGGSAGFTFLAGEPATNDIFDGVDTTWGRVPGGAEIEVMAGDVIAHFDAAHPAASVPTLLKIHHILDGLPADPVLDDKRLQLGHLLQECLGLSVETTIPQAEVVPGETLQMQHSVTINSNLPVVSWLGVRYPGMNGLLRKEMVMDISGNHHQFQFNGTNRIIHYNATRQLPAQAPLTVPYWLREEGTTGRFRVDDASLIGRPENPPVFPLEQVFVVDGEEFTIPDEPVQVIHDPAKGEIRHALWVIPPVSLKFVDNVELFPPGAPRAAVVEVTAARDNVKGTLRLEALAGWGVSPPSQPFSIGKSGGAARLTFTITAPAQTGAAEIQAVAEVGGARWHTGRVELSYGHIPPQLLQPPARLKALSLELAVHGRKAGYIPGAGDDVAQAVARMGYEVTQLTGADLTPEKLRGLDAVVVGIRAFNVRTDLAPGMPALFDFATNGGNVIVLYNRPGRGESLLHVGPYTVNLSGERVTDETAEMTLLAPDHPVFNTPNKIVPADFDGWVQERGAYFASQWDPRFIPLLACHDPGEQPLKGSLLVAPCGQGHVVYTALSWFRQLPDGVPGAYRLFANLLSLGK